MRDLSIRTSQPYGSFALHVRLTVTVMIMDVDFEIDFRDFESGLVKTGQPGI